MELLVLLAVFATFLVLVAGLILKQRKIKALEEELNGLSKLGPLFNTSKLAQQLKKQQNKEFLATVQKLKEASDKIVKLSTVLQKQSKTYTKNDNNHKNKSTESKKTK